MINLKKTSNKKLVQLFYETDVMNIVEEVSRRINLGLIPLAMIEFPKLSNKKLIRLEALTFCDWAVAEVSKRMKDGRIPFKVVTIEEIRDMYRRAREASA